MVRIRKLRKEHYDKIGRTLQHAAKPAGVDIVPLFLFKASLPPGMWGTIIPVFGVPCIIISNRLRSEKTIVETLKHEMIHLRLRDHKHGREFKRACVAAGLNPKKHV